MFSKEIDVTFYSDVERTNLGHYSAMSASRNPVLYAAKLCPKYVPMVPVFNEAELAEASVINMNRDPSERFQIVKQFTNVYKGRKSKTQIFLPVHAYLI